MSDAHITPPQISEERRKAIWTEATDMRRFFDEATVREWTAEQFADEINRQWLEQLEPVAFCELTQSGKIAYFDGRPMVMPGTVCNSIHPHALYRIKEQGC